MGATTIFGRAFGSGTGTPFGFARSRSGLALVVTARLGACRHAQERDIGQRGKVVDDGSVQTVEEIEDDLFAGARRSEIVVVVMIVPRTHWGTQGSANVRSAEAVRQGCAHGKERTGCGRVREGHVACNAVAINVSAVFGLDTEGVPNLARCDARFSV
ncbi:BQ5605_C001g00339 [Microbotryum silenes-dioicae]|uniref:BQ5605_C001g00339 protein n=1 Tax=Microbotryum silenes-dioicae TaxID=796604 RepID=A0A2X0M6H6_9BASI|nr:BQ5605_C001g00339 [Microbotryum silenes-dioicae]